MENVFYFASIVFILESIRGIITVKSEIASYKVGRPMPDKNMMNDPEKLKETMNDLIGELKSKALPSIIGFLALIWNIVGICNATERTLFIYNLSVICLSSLIIGFNEKARSIFMVVTVNTLSISIMSYILYSHFFSA